MPGFKTVAAGWLACVLLVLTSASHAAKHTSDSLETVKKNVASEKAVLVDVRELPEWNRGHIEAALLVPLSKLTNGDADQVARHVPRDKIVYTYCAVGKRALTAGDISQKLGYQVRPLKAGYTDLLRAGFNKASGAKSGVPTSANNPLSFGTIVPNEPQ